MASLSPHIPDGILPEDREAYERLAKLQDISRQVFELRALLPDKLVNPAQAAISNPSANPPQDIAAKLKAAAVTGSRDIKTFKKDFHGEDMKLLWQKVNTSEFPQGEDMWTRDYLELAKTFKSSEGEPGGKAPAEAVAAELPKIDEAEAFKTFRENYPTIEAKSLQDDQTLPLELTIDGATFMLEHDPTGTSHSIRLRLPNEGASPKWAQDVLNHIDARQASEPLGQMLSLLVSYKDAKSTQCTSCGKVFDNDLRFPLVRKLKEESSKDKMPLWIPLHDGCID